MTVQNDRTKRIARPAVVIASVRSGGTYLAHCLSNHPQVFCDRGESLHHSSVWHKHIKADPVRLLHCLLHMEGYRVSMCKLTHSQAFTRAIWAYVKRHKPAVIWLRRENVLRQTVSVLINRAARRGKVKRPQHTFKATGPFSIGLSAPAILKQARGLRARDERAARMLSNFKRVLKLTYRDITDASTPGKVPVPAARSICKFLGVPYAPLACDLVRVNPQPLSEIIRNWPAVEPALRASEFAKYLEDHDG